MSVNKSEKLQWSFLGSMDYQKAWDLQRSLAEARAQGRIGDTLLLLEHPAVYTLGRTSRESDLLFPVDYLESLGARVVRVDRGGQITFHGPGQLVGYPIMDVRSWGGGPLRYVRGLEATLIGVLDAFGIAAGRADKPTGIWVEDEKIAAIGVKVSRRVTTHGFALNVATDLSWFQNIVPCGMPDAGVTSMERLLGSSVSLEEVIPIVVERFGKETGRAMMEISSGSLLAQLVTSPVA